MDDDIREAAEKLCGHLGDYDVHWRDKYAADAVAKLIQAERDRAKGLREAAIAHVRYMNRCDQIEDYGSADMYCRVDDCSFCSLAKALDVKFCAHCGHVMGTYQEGCPARDDPGGPCEAGEGG